MSYSSRILNPQEQKLFTLDRELISIVHALKIHEIIIIGSPHPIYVFTDHKLFKMFYKKILARFYRAQMQPTNSFKLQNNSHTWKKNYLSLIC